MPYPDRKILYVQYAPPGVYPPIERSAWLFKKNGWQVDFLGIRAIGSSRNLTPTMHSESHVEYLVHEPGGWRALRSYFRFWLRAFRRAQLEKPDVVYVSDSIWTYPAGLLIALMTPALTIMHEHDTPLDHSTRMMRFLQAARRQFARKADLLINPQLDRARDMAELAGGREVVVVLNCPSLEELSRTLSFEDKPHGLVLWHHGSLNSLRMPLTILDALAQLPPDVTLEFAGYETVNSEGFVDSFLARAAELGISDRVVFHGALKRDLLYSRANQAHVGLSVFVQKFVEPMVGASNKPFDFLGCNMALLVNDTTEWHDFAVVRKIALPCDPTDSTSIARAIEKLYHDRKQLRQMADRGRTLVETEWNYEAQFAPVLDRIEMLLGHGPRRDAHSRT
mgnify:CR=1 FL=1